VGFGHEPQSGLFGGIGGHSQELQTHTTGNSTNGNAVHHRVECKVILAVAVFLGGVDIGEDHLCDPLHDGGGIHRGLVSDGSLDILFLIGKEVVRLAAPADIVLTQQTVQGLPDSFTQGDLVHPDIVGHEDDDVIQICRDVIIDVADEIQELQHIHIVGFDAISGIRCTGATLDNTADGTVQEAMYGVIEAEERNEGILVLILHLLCGLLETGQHGTFTT